MGLFSTLKSIARGEHDRLEDFHTEIVAQVLNDSPELLCAWLKRLNLLDGAKPESGSVATQESYKALPGHAVDSRPDLTIRLSWPSHQEVVFVESKLPSKQGENQLLRYTEQLEAVKAHEQLRRASLVFITRDYEAAAAEVQQWPNFRATRWADFYRLVKAGESGDGLRRELRIFMEEHKMSLSNQFRSTDLVALENYIGAQALMNEVLAGEVAQAAAEAFGAVSHGPNWEEPHDDPRYVIGCGSWNTTLTLRAGFWVPTEPGASVMLGVKLYRTKRLPEPERAWEVFQKFAEGGGRHWAAYRADNGWVSLTRHVPLPSFMAGEDHVRAAKDFLLKCLSEVSAFRSESKFLVWGS